MERKFGWRPQFPDPRDLKYAVSWSPKALPDEVDLRSDFSPPLDQGKLSSCVANGVAACLQYLQNINHYPWRFTPSRLLLYYECRAREGTILQDAGAYIRDAIKVINEVGVCPETSNPGWSWKYSDDPVRFRLKPPAACYKNALGHKSLLYKSVNNRSLTELKSVLAEGFPIVFGSLLYESFFSPDVTKTGMVLMPKSGEKIAGGHCQVICGYIENLRVFIVRNSWGQWGDQGSCYIPYEYLTNPDLASDFWYIQRSN